MSINIWRLAWSFIWVRNETLRWHKVEELELRHFPKSQDHMVCSLRARVDKKNQSLSERGKVKAATYLHGVFFWSPQEK